ncbi:transposase [Novosphingobium chloroacetimidivorans]|uniref:Transposase n=2 Tax=Novosphingobium chloroacetimidivorans TaxID=1428314 RepID=A0A7W7NY09_9SPHN|nr:transposase [Novosphingobium chloroacetimidivorans]
MGQVTVMSEPERRRRWSHDERLQILRDAFSPGACVAEVARRYDVSTALIYIWRRKLREAGVERAAPELASPGFAEAVIQDGGAVTPTLGPLIVVDLARDRRVSIFASASPALVAAALKALR